MENINKAANSAHKTVGKVDRATSQAAEALGEKEKQLKNAEQQLMKNCRSYVRYNPWITQ